MFDPFQILCVDRLEGLQGLEMERPGKKKIHVVVGSFYIIFDRNHLERRRALKAVPLFNN